MASGKFALTRSKREENRPKPSATTTAGKKPTKVGTMKEDWHKDAERGKGIEERFLDCAGRRVRSSERGRKNVGLLRSQ
jgi:hypothetical protein